MSKSTQAARPRPSDPIGNQQDLTEQIRQANAELGAAVREMDGRRRGGRAGRGGQLALIAGVTCAVAVGVFVLRWRSKR
ncbi:MAG TPA: hypothetical protein VN767_20675 [Streptosporangiaceae bacterium]|jgi:hypothetical protein|nr:hypothetical protein [Streptosporangiaceae bacterium]